MLYCPLPAAAPPFSPYMLFFLLSTSCLSPQYGVWQNPCIPGASAWRRALETLEAISLPGLSLTCDCCFVSSLDDLPILFWRAAESLQPSLMGTTIITKDQMLTDPRGHKVHIFGTPTQFQASLSISASALPSFSAIIALLLIPTSHQGEVMLRMKHLQHFIAVPSGQFSAYLLPGDGRAHHFSSLFWCSNRTSATEWSRLEAWVQSLGKATPLTSLEYTDSRTVTKLRPHATWVICP
ncbi:hypothetical protein QBC45DRAFT_25540 [Copromyces sp. CBS 386.78]|nr:hypothetical protein QBC45DRAFT_25540 [Copromyces sp. CBS 386.78]